MEAANRDLEIKLTQLQIIRDKTESVLASRNRNYLSAGVYARIKTDTRPRVGNQGEPVAERTKLGWVILSPQHDQGEVYREF